MMCLVVVSCQIDFQNTPCMGGYLKDHVYNANLPTVEEMQVVLKR